MPARLDAPRRGILNSLHFGEPPRTRFLDWIDAIRVELINGPDRLRINGAMREMKQATWADSVDLAYQRSVTDAAAAHPLPLFAEVPSFTFRVSGISRIIAQQITRTRLGVTFSMQGTGDQDCRHRDALVPRYLNRPEKAERLSSYIHVTLGAKHEYAQALDAGESLVGARYALPQNLAGFIYVHISLLALQGLVGKRLCTYETQEYNMVAELMRSEVRFQYLPFAAGLVADCDGPGGCHYMRAKNPAVAGSMYLPDAKHDVYDWSPEDFVYRQTRDEMLAGPRFVPRSYVGFERVE